MSFINKQKIVLQRGAKIATHRITVQRHSPPYKRTQNNKEKPKNLLPHREHTQSTKSIKVEGPSFIHNLVSDQSKYTKEAFSLWMDSTLSSKAILFLAFQMTQNKHNGPTCHTTFLFLPTKEPLHPKRVSFYRKRKYPRYSK